MTRRRWIAVAIAAVVALAAAGAGLARWRAQNDDPIFGTQEAKRVLGDYLDAVEHGDYAAAAELLAVGDEALGERPDLRPLEVDELSVEALAAGLEDYCSNGCIALTSIDLDEAGGSAYRAVVSFGEPRGHPLERSFTVGERDDGTRYVRGLPPAGTGTLPRPE